MTLPELEIQEGTLIAGYRVQGVLGIGGSGSVYRAERLADGALVALKLLNAEHAANEGERQRFAREAEVVRQLAHPHVVALLDYGFVGDLPFLVFPLLEGRTLEARIATEGKVGWGLTGRFSEQALSALEVAHGRSIAHRDIKPANLFCHRTAAGESIQILDFGTAKIVGPKRSIAQEVTRHGALIGTPRYMSPEQVRGEALTPAADIYSFGLVMAEMLLGRPLVTGASDFEMYVEQGSDVPHELPEEVRASPFAAVIERAVAKPLDVRYRLAGQMLADVRAVLARYEQGASARGFGADLEVTRFLGVAPEPEPMNEAAEKLRKAFNAVASKAPAPPTAAPSEDLAGLPTLVLPALSDPPLAAAAAFAGLTAFAPAEVLHAAQPDPPTRGDSPSTTGSVVTAPSKPRGSRVLAMLAMGAAFVVAGTVAATVIRSRSAPNPGPSSSAESAAANDDASPTASSVPTSSSPPATAPPGAFTTTPIDPAPLARFVAQKSAKPSPELYELALRGMTDCAIPADGEPSCPEWSAYEATTNRPMSKGDAKKRLSIASKYLQHAAPSVRILAARLHSTVHAEAGLDALLAAAKVEPDPAVLAELVGAMASARPDLVAFELATLDHPDVLVRARAARALGAAVHQPDVAEALGKLLASNEASRVRAAACTGFAVQPTALPLDPVVRAVREGTDEVRTECFAALTAAWVRTPKPRQDAYDATLALLSASPRTPKQLPTSLGRLARATVRFPPEDTVGPPWLEQAVFYDAKKLCAVLEDVALDPASGLSLRKAALQALGSIDGKKREKAARKKVAELGDEDSKELVAKAKKD